MFNSDKEPYINFAKIYNYNTTIVVADTIPVQMEIMNAGYVDGLVGQLPYAPPFLYRHSTGTTAHKTSTRL